MRTRRESRTATLVPLAVRHYLMTGVDDPSLEGKWRVFELLFGPLGSTRDEWANWDRATAAEPYRGALRDEGLRLPPIPDIDD